MATKNKQNPPPPSGGIINLRKAVGPGSMDMVRQLRRLLQVKKIGHVGTLDPFADGVLPIAIGKATNMIHYMEEQDKRYRVFLYFGESTDTQDLSGKIIRKNKIDKGLLQDLTANDGLRIREVISSLTGSITQETPKFSAAKIQGRPMYEYARKGIEVVGKLRHVEIYSAELLQLYSDESKIENDRVLPDILAADAEFFPDLEIVEGFDAAKEVHQTALAAVIDIHCSKGTYIRTWVQELGNKLGVGAYAARLRRMASGPFCIQNSHSIAEIARHIDEISLDKIEENQNYLLPADRARPDLPVLELEESLAVAILQGKRLDIEQRFAPNTLVRLYHSEQFLGLGRVVVQNKRMELHAERMFLSLEDFTY